MKTYQMKTKAPSLFARICDWLSCFFMQQFCFMAVNMVTQSAGATTVVFRDGSTVTANSSGVYSCPLSFITDRLNAGDTYESGTSGPLDNMTATTDPLVTSDTAAGYAIGSLWYNKTAGRLYECSDATAGAAVWSVASTGLAAIAANGLNNAIYLPLAQCRNIDGSAVTAAAGAGVFGNTVSLGTSQFLVGEAAKSATITDSVMVEAILPTNYVAGENITVTANGQFTGTGTVGTKTLACTVYKNAKDGTQSANLVASGSPATLILTTATDYAFVVTGTTLNPGDKITIELVAALQESAGVNNLTAQINSVRIS